MRYVTFGRSQLDVLCEVLTSYDRAGRVFSLPLACLFQDRGQIIEEGPLAGNKRANFFPSFDIGYFLTKSEPDFILVDLFGSVKDRIYYSSSGAMFPGDYEVLGISEEVLSREYSYFDIDDPRYLRLAFKNLCHFACLLNSHFPKIKVVIIDFFTTNFYVKEDSNLQKFSALPIYGSRWEYFDFSSYRYVMSGYLSRSLRARVANSQLIDGAFNGVCKPPSVLSPTHFSESDYLYIAGKLAQTLENWEGTPYSHDDTFELMSHMFRSHETLLSVIQNIEYKVDRLLEAKGRIE